MTFQPTTSSFPAVPDFPPSGAWARLMGIRARIESRSQLCPIPETRPIGPGTGPTQERVDARERKRKRQDRDAARARARARFATEEQRTI